MIGNYRERKRREAESAEVANLRSEMDAIASSVAVTEGVDATDNHTAGSLLVIGGKLCRLTRAVVRGERFVEGINVTPVSVAEIIDAIEGKE